jgi:hypothetical protein
MNKRKLLILIPVVALLSNAVGYLIVSKVRGTARSDRKSPGDEHRTHAALEVSGERRRGDSRDDRPAAGQGAGPAGSRLDPVADPVKEETALARRAAGLAALEDGDYEKAFTNFSKARDLLGDRAHVGELLRVANDLRNRPRAAARARPSEPSRAAAGLRVAPRMTAGRRSVRREAVAAEADPGQGTVPQGLIVVTTNPRGLLVRVDETPVDLTPMRTKVRSGSHRVALFDGDRKVYETTLEVREGATATVQRDVGTEGRAESIRAAPPAPVVAPAADEESRRPGSAPLSESRPVPAAARPLSPPVAPATHTGTLQVSSPGLYGVVWINGRPRGYPPLAIGDLPSGPTRVEVRVNGVQKWISTVVVQPGVTTSVNLRSLSSQGTAP